MNWSYFASPSTFYRLAGRLAPWFFALAALTGLPGLYVGLVMAPTDAQQGEVYRVIFIHVPAAWMSMFLYFVMALWGAAALSFNTRLSAMMARAIAPTGALFTFIALWTGSFWGKPTWGTYWVWDARLTSELVLLFLYFGYSTLRHGCDSDDDGSGPPRPAATAARTAFIMIFMAELGDKTQLVTASQAAQHSASLSGMAAVFASSTLALWSVSLLGIFAGKQLVRFVPLCWIHRAAGFMFLVFGVIGLLKLKGM